MKIVWSPLALERVVEIAEFIARDRPQAAARWADAVFASVLRLEQFPESGRRVPESPRSDLREVIHGRYRVIYRLDPDRVTVLTVRHGRQDLQSNDPDLQ
ncbi:MAG TPA: type II toxin-antitoxin system RelE/ParE family toxin [Longimicrobium sp.]|nr:type II toxin-antitoxin system RelE/ParE family toxin [Longimicrobium sp.]